MNHLDQIRMELAKKSPLYLQVKVIPQASNNEIISQMEDGTYKIRIAAPPERGQANEALCRFLKKSLNASEVVVLTGGRGKVKLIRISL